MKSMTGYGNAKISREGLDVQAEIKSVNGRYLELKLYLPRELSFFEPTLRKLISSQITRGTVEVRINIADHRDCGVQLNRSKLIKYYLIMQQAVETLEIQEAISLSHLINEPGVIETVNNYDEDVLLHQLLNECINTALQTIDLALQCEGENMYHTLKESMHLISQELDQVEMSLTEYKQEMFINMHNRIKEILADFKIDTLEQRLVQELAIYIDRSDVQEEITRLKSHIQTFMSTIDTPTKSELGKTLNFIMQEMQRESNTLGSKYSTAKSFKHILIIKEEIEKNREIVQNVS